MDTNTTIHDNDLDNATTLGITDPEILAYFREDDLREIARLKAENAMLLEVKALRAENARMKRNAWQRSYQAKKREAKLAGYAPLVTTATMTALGYAQ